jgi:FixJ family two-component response regulator
VPPPGYWTKAPYARRVGSRSNIACRGGDLESTCEAFVTTPPIIAIVDDDLSVRRALRRLVEAGGYTGQTFASAREFLDSLARVRPACLVLDIQLDHGMSGFELHERLVADRMGIPVIFITAHDDAATRKRIDNSGAASHLWKPVDEQTLLDAIRRAIA